MFGAHEDVNLVEIGAGADDFFQNYLCEIACAARNENVLARIEAFNFERRLSKVFLHYMLNQEFYV